MHKFVFDKNKVMVEKITVPGSRLKNCYRIDKDVYRSDQPSYRDFRALEQFGIKEVLNLRNRHNDKYEARGTDIKLHRLRMKASKMNQDDLLEAMRILRDREGPILIHCWHGSDRTGAVCAMYQILFLGISKEDAVNAMVDGEYGFHMIFDQLIDMLHGTDVEHMKQALGIS